MIMLSVFVAFAVPLAVVLSLNSRLRASVPLVVWWFFSILGFVLIPYSLSVSTSPSLAPRVAAVGKAYDCVDKSIGRTTKFGFRFVPEHGDPIDIETLIIIPGWANAEKFNGRIWRIVYLEDRDRDPKNEAIDIEIVSGDHAGWHDSRDARPFGFWLGIPAAIALMCFGILGIRFRKGGVTSTIAQPESMTDDAGTIAQ
jgi:hypothetical protein